jgi:toxin FitB
MIEARFPDPLPIDDRVAREWGHLQAIVATGGGQPRRRAADLAIAATARVHDAVLFTNNRKDFLAIAGLIDVRTLGR